MVWSRESVGSRAPFLYQDSLGLCLLFKERKEIKEAVPNVKCLCTLTAFNISLYQKQREDVTVLYVFFVTIRKENGCLPARRWIFLW